MFEPYMNIAFDKNGISSEKGYFWGAEKETGKTKFWGLPSMVHAIPLSPLFLVRPAIQTGCVAHQCMSLVRIAEETQLCFPTSGGVVRTLCGRGL